MSVTFCDSHSIKFLLMLIIRCFQILLLFSIIENNKRVIMSFAWADDSLFKPRLVKMLLK